MAMAGLLLSGSPADAVPTITFDQAAPRDFGGTVSYATLGGTLVGNDIKFTRIIVSGVSPALDIAYDCQTCRLDFTSGPNVLPGPNIYQWGGGGTFVLYGGSILMGIDPGYTDPTCDDDAIDDDCDPQTVLLSGTFNSSPPNLGSGGGSTFNFISTGVDEKNADLVAYLKIDPLNWTYAESNLSLGTVEFNSDGTFEDALVTQADIINKLPEPGSALLLLLGLGSLAAYRRRQD
jgi:hypothetical protein